MINWLVSSLHGIALSCMFLIRLNMYLYFGISVVSQESSVDVRKQECTYVAELVLFYIWDWGGCVSVWCRVSDMGYKYPRICRSWVFCLYYFYIYFIFLIYSSVFLFFSTFIRSLVSVIVPYVHSVFNIWLEYEELPLLTLITCICPLYTVLPACPLYGQ
jgi:hypothetical protein